MATNGLTVRIAEAARITEQEAFSALAAAFHGLLEIACPTTVGNNPVEVFITVNPPPPPKGRRKAPLRHHGELIGFIAESAGISVPSAARVLGVITQAILEGSQTAGLRAYFEYEPR